MSQIDRRSLLYFFGIASVTPLLHGQTDVTAGVVSVCKPGQSRFAFSATQQAWISPCKLTSEDSRGALSAFELNVLSQAGPTLHVHHREDEWYFVLTGEFLFKAGGDEHTLPTGASVWLPRGIPHTWINTSSAQARLLLVCQPGGFEKFFDEMGREMADVHDHEVFLRRMKEIMSKYGMEMLGPPLKNPLRAP